MQVLDVTTWYDKSMLKRFLNLNIITWIILILYVDCMWPVFYVGTLSFKQNFNLKSTFSNICLPNQI